MDAPEFFVQFKAGTSIFRENEPGTEMYIIREGQVEILKSMRGSNHRVAVLDEGDFFGEMAILDDLPRSASARALTDCVVLRIDRSTFDQMVRHNPEIPVRMLRKLSRRLRAADPSLADVDPRLQAGGGAAAEQPRRADSAPQPEIGPRLVHLGTGTEFPLAASGETFVGRYDAATGVHPEIDLKPVDTDRSISRRHARVVRRGERFFVVEEIGTSNGTFVNRHKVDKGVEVEFRDGDEVQFGLVKTVFRRA
jgi:CRP-like cAMP-binding protein